MNLFAYDGIIESQKSADKILHNIHELLGVKSAKGAVDRKSQNRFAICGDVRDKKQWLWVKADFPNANAERHICTNVRVKQFLLPDPV